MADLHRQDEPEYFSVGHDDAQTELREHTISSSDKEIACLFCGIGDARNLFATIAYMSLNEARNPSSKRFHFTILDIKPAVLARDLLMFRLLFDLSTQSKRKKRETLVTLSYIFGAQVMPKWAYDRLQTGLSAVLTDLKSYDGDMMGIFYIPLDVRTLISQHVQAWKEVPEPWYNATRLRELAHQQLLERQMTEAGLTDGIDIKVPPGCEDNGQDALYFKDLTAMLPHTDLLEKYEPRLLKLFTAYAGSGSITTRRNVEEYLDSNWQPNVTVIDLDYENKREARHMPLLDFQPHSIVQSLFGNIPVTYLNTHGVLNHFIGFFDFIATCMNKLQSKIVIEVIIGEMVDVCERLRHGILRQHQEKLGNLEPSTFPNAFDGIQMSNIPLVTPRSAQRILLM
jgi:hypothetical protein